MYCLVSATPSPDARIRIALAEKAIAFAVV